MLTQKSMPVALDAQRERRAAVEETFLCNLAIANFTQCTTVATSNFRFDGGCAGYTAMVNSVVGNTSSCWSAFADAQPTAQCTAETAAIIHAYRAQLQQAFGDGCTSSKLGPAHAYAACTHFVSHQTPPTNSLQYRLAAELFDGPLSVSDLRRMGHLFRHLRRRLYRVVHRSSCAVYYRFPDKLHLLLRLAGLVSKAL